ncbi:four helix bundle protein [Candidatus Poribacteria bacterium]
MRNYRKLGVWQHADELTVQIYRVTQRFLSTEMYGITSQLRRAAYSVPANIAEGSGRESNADYLRFLSIAQGSLAETEYFLHLARRLEYLSEDDWSQLTGQVNQTFAALIGLMKAIRKSLKIDL